MPHRYIEASKPGAVIEPPEPRELSWSADLNCLAINRLLDLMRIPRLGPLKPYDESARNRIAWMQVNCKVDFFEPLKARGGQDE